ncbi:MAG TPA: GGDEF domain-containing protein [bacterium]|nr:GGDEF domain-containing protein [bacterium]
MDLDDIDGPLAGEAQEGGLRPDGGGDGSDWSAAAFMATQPLAVPASEAVLRVCERMAKARLGQVLVVPDSWTPGSAADLPPEPLGIFTERDLIRAFVQHKDSVISMRVGDLMTAPVVTIGPQEDILHAADLMTLMRIRRLPVVQGGRTLGLLTRGRVMDAQSRRLADMAHQNQVLRRSVVHDSLTGLANRVLFDRVLASELAGMEQRPFGVSVLELDIDHFKRVNDTYGHPTGDLVLSRLAGVLRETLRRADLAARVGGEEFAVVLSRGGDKPEAVAEKLRAAVEKAVFGEADKPLKISISVGCATARPKEGPAELFKRADEALYQAKNTGRNKVVMAV